MPRLTRLGRASYRWHQPPPGSPARRPDAHLGERVGGQLSGAAARRAASAGRSVE
jgi:hypothetical protein